MTRWFLPLLLLACDEGADPTPVDASPPPDARATDAGDLDAAPAPDPDAAPEEVDAAAAEPDADLYPDARLWPSRARPVGVDALAAPGGFRWMRGLIHMHSPHSHDACDNNPKPDGMFDLDCLADLRWGVCHDRHDFLLLTDHPGHLTEATLEEALWIGPEDRPVTNEAGDVVGNRWACPDDDREVWVAAGSEGALMPVMLTRMPPPEDLGSDDPETVLALRDAGALVLQSHWENHDLEHLRELRLDGAEIYNLHANLDPNGPYFVSVIREVAAFLEARFDGGHPDLGFLAAVRPHAEALARWDALLPTQRLTGFAGSDIHQNTNLLRTWDGERLDSYRRLGSWFANYLLVDEVSLDGVRAAFGAGRVLVVFQVLGEPRGFDYAGEGPGGRVEMGGTGAAEGTTLRFAIDAGDDPLQVKLLRITADGAEEVLVTDGPFSHPVEAPGVYRVEVARTPEHLRPELGVLADTFVRPTIWLYTNPVYLE